jgi:hypothetical protein
MQGYMSSRLAGLVLARSLGVLSRFGRSEDAKKVEDAAELGVVCRLLAENAAKNIQLDENIVTRAHQVMRRSDRNCGDSGGAF